MLLVWTHLSLSLSLYIYIYIYILDTYPRALPREVSQIRYNIIKYNLNLKQFYFLIIMLNMRIIPYMCKTKNENIKQINLYIFMIFNIWLNPKIFNIGLISKILTRRLQWYNLQRKKCIFLTYFSSYMIIYLNMINFFNEKWKYKLLVVN